MRHERDLKVVKIQECGRKLVRVQAAQDDVNRDLAGKTFMAVRDGRHLRVHNTFLRIMK